jgi:hypothetical protein
MLDRNVIRYEDKTAYDVKISFYQQMHPLLNI